MASTAIRPRVALATCSRLPELDDETRLLVPALAAHGIDATPQVWDAPDVDWTVFDLTVVRSTWDYTEKLDAFLEWAGRVPRLWNPYPVLAWNTDKRYLEDLRVKGVDVVPTRWLSPRDAPPVPGCAPGDDFVAAETGVLVIKPAVSAGSRDSGRYDLANPVERELAAKHVARLQTAGRVVMVQPYLSAIDEEGETSIVYLGGALSHAVRKAPALTGPDEYALPWDPDEPRGPVLEAVEPTPAQIALAERALVAIPGDAGQLLYARVDMVTGPEGRPVLMELELTEPSLFFENVRGSERALASAIARLV